MKKILCLAFVLMSVFQGRSQTLFNTGWEFVKDIDTATSKKILLSKADKTLDWEKITLPHTPHIEPVIKIKEQWQGTCYYRKYFTMPAANKGKYIAVQFDAAMNDADVYLNGKHVYKHVGGYLPFTIDVSHKIKFGAQNCLLVKLVNEDNPHIPPGKPVKDLDFNFYGGIYRSAWLIVKDPVHISNAVAANHEAGGGVMVHYEDVTAASAKVVVKTEVENAAKAAAPVQVLVSFMGKDGKKVAENRSIIQKVSGTAIFEQSLTIKSPKLWSPMHPNLYSLVVQVIKNNKVADQLGQLVGIKTFRFTADAFYLNGEKLNIVGTNRHQEYPYVGYALSDNAQYNDAWKIKEAGMNFVRCSHYPPSPVFLNACDQLGILVMDAIPGWQFFGDEIFQKNSYQNIRDMIHRDRNHASIVLWEASLNESGMSKAYMTEANRIVHAELPFKDVYSIGWIDYAYDVFSPARQHAKAPNYWKKYSKGKPVLLAEYGDWEYYAQNAGFNQKAYEGLKSEERNSRQLRTDGEARMLQQAYNFQEAHNDDLKGPNFGDVNWLMFDYKRGYASDIESSGIMDIYRLPKFAFYFYQSQYGPKPDDKGFGKPMVFIANYWNDPATKTVKVYSNCDEVELLLNGKPIARQKPDKDPYSNNLPHPPFTFAISKFEIGKLEAVGYLNHVKVADAIRQTPGRPNNLMLDWDVWAYDSPMDEIQLVYAKIVDAAGTLVPDAAIDVRFKVTGNCEIIGDEVVKSEAGIAPVLIKIHPGAGKIKVSAALPGDAENIAPYIEATINTSSVKPG
ncbi:beta-galactosidase [Mucilaginibacter sp. PPCGB 2223]|uniref:glycoside hydrolase family 2 TIM barrel-domain containing protein n=1 Tax=Mucilaginibacter sp. PPCGB 2223 TaxID=1886027 RepID=UPI00082440AB|nr:glycoside hydrolase family 2 TIM barrel-domain containing protein [Mucilaginibacter sp. PPCGB 2223]OCX52827.1 beta-galactosidase [Mucilaginibacter sp. PPCGB 2223]